MTPCPSLATASALPLSPERFKVGSQGPRCAFDAGEHPDGSIIVGVRLDTEWVTRPVVTEGEHVRREPSGAAKREVVRDDLREGTHDEPLSGFIEESVCISIQVAKLAWDSNPKALFSRVSDDGAPGRIPLSPVPMTSRHRVTEEASHRGDDHLGQATVISLVQILCATA